MTLMKVTTNLCYWSDLYRMIQFKPSIIPAVLRPWQMGGTNSLKVAVTPYIGSTNGTTETAYS
jgi:hypothetical protein